MKLTGLEAKVVRALLHYLYTGKCCFTLEDLNLGVEVCLTKLHSFLTCTLASVQLCLRDTVDGRYVSPFPIC